eukprot:CAMPEP_0184417402 /NCGR_PEP_ID=MMETSP0738-20130409/10168_1 /TAXON_ID=385413 /ORGANISM="Thalassiosira miniscula, Strain CCMP1093" /LENGTH=50 /DNA_ID=CAMNT_0026777053 /DNA_START=298 /DNA_END=447 /DNA_ORIENTATION=+
MTAAVDTTAYDMKFDFSGAAVYSLSFLSINTSQINAMLNYFNVVILQLIN